MPKLMPIKMKTGEVLYMEVEEALHIPKVSQQEEEEEEVAAVSKGGTSAVVKTTMQNFEALEKTLSSFTHYALNAFKDVAGANVDRVTLEFGVTLGGEAGVPYITKGKAEGNLKIKVECSWPQKPDASVK